MKAESFYRSKAMNMSSAGRNSWTIDRDLNARGLLIAIGTIRA